MLPAGNASTCGVYSQPFWSNVTGSVGTSSALPFGRLHDHGDVLDAAARADDQRRIDDLRPFFPHTSLSLVTSIFSGAGGCPIELDGAAERAAVGDRDDLVGLRGRREIHGRQCGERERGAQDRCSSSLVLPFVCVGRGVRCYCDAPEPSGTTRRRPLAAVRRLRRREPERDHVVAERQDLLVVVAAEDVGRTVGLVRIGVEGRHLRARHELLRIVQPLDDPVRVQACAPPSRGSAPSCRANPRDSVVPCTWHEKQER